MSGSPYNSRLARLQPIGVAECEQPLAAHVDEIAMIVEVWRDAGGWWASTCGSGARCGPTPELALAAVTGSWPHEAWLARVGERARRRFGAASASAAPPRTRCADGALGAARAASHVDGTAPRRTVTR